MASEGRKENNVWTPEATTHKCPQCGSRDTRKSLLRGPIDTLIRMFDMWPYRCRKCSNRFIRRLPRTAAAEPAESTESE